MSWVVSSLAAVVLWAFRGLLGKLALRTVGRVQLLHERLAPLQIAGVALAVAAVVLIGIGG